MTSVTPYPELAAIVLAAGGSRRLGTAKQLLLWRDETLVNRAVSLARAVCGADIVLVTGAAADSIEQSVSGHVERGLGIVHNPDWEQGMGTSLATGARAISEGAAAGVLVLLCDQPLLTANDLVSLVRLWQNSPNRPAVCAYSDALGVPAVFPRDWFPRLAQLTGERGAQSLFADADVSAIPLPGAARDIDTPQDWHALQQYKDKG